MARAKVAMNLAVRHSRGIVTLVEQGEMDDDRPIATVAVLCGPWTEEELVAYAEALTGPPRQVATDRGGYWLMMVIDSLAAVGVNEASARGKIDEGQGPLAEAFKGGEAWLYKNGYRR